jgi:DNA-binding transcriptional ArsR family regulator/uncharacterized protein YndB with AHSA1/START domain
MDDVFRALADPNRRRLLDTLNVRSGLTLHQLCEGLDMARQSVSKHLAILEKAGLVVTVRRGREKLHYLNAAPINDITDRWINHYNLQRVQALADLKVALEDSTSPAPPFVYQTYIDTDPPQLWHALTDPAFTRRYWGVTFSSDWEEGAPFTVEQHGVTVADPGQVVLESEPYRRLSYTWPAFTAEWAQVNGWSDDLQARSASEPRSRVSFDIEAMDAMVGLTVRHEGFGPHSAVRARISQDWPRVLSSLKTLLETGHSLALDDRPPPGEREATAGPTWTTSRRRADGRPAQDA